MGIRSAHRLITVLSEKKSMSQEEGRSVDVDSHHGVGIWFAERRPIIAHLVCFYRAFRNLIITQYLTGKQWHHPSCHIYTRQHS